MAGIPEGLHTITPHITVSNAAKAIEFYKQAFGAAELPGTAKTPDGRIMHASMRIGDSVFMLNDEFPEMGGCHGPQGGKQPFTLHIYWPDVDQAWQKAVSSGAKITMPLADMFWGDRYGHLEDPFGFTWAMATHKQDVPHDVSNKAGQEAFGAMQKAGKK